MKRAIFWWIMGISAFFLLGFMFQWGMQQREESLLTRCCTACVTAFESSPVGVGPQAARCGEFTSAVELIPQCSAFFKERALTVEECTERRQESKRLI